MRIPPKEAFLGELKSLLEMCSTDPERAEKVAAIYMKHLLKPPIALTTKFDRIHFKLMLDATRIKVMTHMIPLPTSVTFKVPSLHYQLRAELKEALWYYKETDNGWYLVSTHPDFPGSDSP